MVQCPRASDSRVNVDPMSEGPREGAVMKTGGRGSLWRRLPYWNCDFQLGMWPDLWYSSGSEAKE